MAHSVSPDHSVEFEANAGQGVLDQLGNRFFQMMMDNAPDLIWAKNMDNRFLFVNRAMCANLLKCDTTAEAVGRTDLFFAVREKEGGHLHTFGEICVDSDQVVKETGRAGRFIEEGFVRGEYLVLDVHKSPIFDSQGTLVGTVGCGRDITEAQTIEKRLRQSEERFCGMADFLPLPIAEFDFDLNLFYANQAGLSWFGYSRQDYARHPNLKNLIPKEISQTIRSWLDRIKQGRRPVPFDVRLAKKDGTTVYGVINAAPIRNGDEVTGVRACFTDLTERRKAEAALRENETRYRTLFNGLNDAVFVHPFAEKGFKNFVEVNDVACEWYGYTRSELLSMSPQDLILEPEGRGMGSAESRQGLLLAGKRTLETLNRKKNNEIFPVELSSSLFEFHGQKMILTTVRDITERRQNEKERADALKFAAEQEKYALVGQVAGKMAHDFNNILGGIMGHAEFSILDCREPEVLKSLEIILQQTRRGKNLTKNLVAFARDQEPKEEFFNINEKLELVLSLLKKDLTFIRVEMDFTKDLPDILADPGMIEHALVNLVQNAIHAMSLTSGAVLTLRTKFVSQNLLIEIHDNGCGIPRGFYDQIYTPSFTLKGSKDIRGAYARGIKGTGYGMSNVKKTIEKHRGKISFTSEEGRGTCFLISIPLVNRELTIREKRRMAEKRVARNCRILLVEDEGAISGVQKKILGQPPFEHQVVLAATGQDAVEAFDRQSFDLVSLDYILPGPLNGLDVYHHIRNKDREIPVVFLSGNIGFLESMKEIKARDRRMDHLSKPCENIVFADTINTWLLGRA